MQEYLEKLLDKRNIYLWNTLNEKFNIVLLESSEPNYINIVVGKTVKIYIDKGNIDPSSFTHELLHIYLSSKGLKIVDDFYNKIDSHPKMPIIFSDELKNHIGNCLAHVLMLPIFLKMGYENSDFISDYQVKKMNSDLMTYLKKEYFKAGSYSGKVVDFYIGKFFAMKACNNKSHNYSKYYNIMGKLDSKMHRLLNEFWDDWQTFDIENPDDNYDEIFDYLIDDLDSWIKNKRIIPIVHH